MAIYSCPHCERVFSRHASLRNHVKTHDDIIDKVLREIAEEVEHEQEEVGDDERLEEASYEEGEEERGSTNNDEIQEEICRDNVILPTSVKKGRQLLDQIVVPHISFKKAPIMTYKQETYYLHYRPIFDVIKELLSNKDIFAHCTFKFTLLNHNGERIYNEQYNGQWWERVQKSLPNGANVLSVILYSDATTRDHLGKTSEHPIYLTLGNIVSWRRNRPDAKILLGYLPILKAKDISQKRSKSFRLAREALTALEYFLESLNEFLDLCEGLTDNETINISWYSYANISSSGDYIRAKSLYYNEPSFSDVSISMSEEESEDYNTAEGGACFGKVLMLINVKIIEKDLSFDLALVQWYDFCNSRQLYKYDCPWLKIINTYNFVPIESIIELVQVVQRAERQNEYFVNTFMF
ncbi:hypothetical protein RhiirB3_494591 [Rhizophagus irregularis]|nr:hypothetical protein RhiirB3_494591 [Rhizophagus irregularis]